MKKYMLYIITVLIALFLTACPFSMEDDRETIFIKNKSEHDISVYFSFIYTDYDKDPIYPDTSLISEDMLIAHLLHVDKGRFSSMTFIPLEELYKERQTDTLSMFIFHSDTLIKYDWEVIRAEYKVLKRYDLAISDIRKLNWDITYPPTEAMKNIKMWPPYGIEQIEFLSLYWTETDANRRAATYFSKYIQWEGNRFYRYPIVNANFRQTKP